MTALTKLICFSGIFFILLCSGNGQLFNDTACTMPEDLFISRYDKSIKRLVVNVTCPTGVGGSFEAPKRQSFGYDPISSRTVRSYESTMYVLVFNTTGSWRQENFTKFHLGDFISTVDNSSLEDPINVITEPLNIRPNLWLPPLTIVENRDFNLSWKINVSDPDQGNLEYVTLTTKGMPRQFEIVNDDGQYWLRLNEPLDAENMNYTRRIEGRGTIVRFFMTVTDRGGLSSNATITIHILDKNDNSPKCQTGVSLAHAFSQRPTSPIMDITKYCSDPDVTGSLRSFFFVDRKDCNGVLTIIENQPASLYQTQEDPDNVTSCDVSLFVTDGSYGTVFDFVLIFRNCSPSIDDYGYEWPKTYPNTESTGVCPPGTIGRAYRKCDDKGIYRDPVYNCTNSDIKELLYKRVNSTVVMTKLQAYSMQVKSKNTTMYAGDVQTISTLLNQIQPNSMNEESVKTNFLDVVNVMIDQDNTNNWRSLVNETGFGAERILKSVDSMVGKLAMIRSTPNETRHYARSNIFMTLESRDVCDGDIDFPDRGNEAVPEWARIRGDTIQIACSDKTVFSSVMFRNVSKMISSQTNAGDMAKLGEVANGPVMSLSVFPETNATLESPVTITFQVFDKSLDLPVCSYWKFSERNDGNGAWASDGCALQSFDQQRGLVVCRCSHLTNFAVLMSPSTKVITIPVGGHFEALSVISLVGCIISMICLFATVVVYGCFWKQLSSQRSLILINLCSTLFVAYLIFLVGVEKTQNKNVCTAIAAILHYVYLCVFFLTLALGLVLVTSVLMPFSRRKMAHFYIGAAYGIPVVIVAISMGATSLEGYGNEHFCWLSVESGLIWAFVGPIMLIILVNIIIIVLVLRTLFGTVSMAKKTDKEKAIAGVRSLIVLVPVLGITWLFGIFAVNKATLVFQYLFAIFNSLQGLLIMITTCFMDRKVKTVLKPYISRRSDSSQSGSTSATGQQKETKVTNESTL